MNIYKIRYGYEYSRYTSDDKYLYCEVDDNMFNELNDDKTRQEIFEIDGKLVRCASTFKNLDRYARDLKEYANSEDLKLIYDKFIELSKTATYDARRDRGYINYLKDFEDTEPEDYYGLLEKYFTEHTRDYVNNKIVFGYLGHSDRTKESDQAICEFLEENPDLIPIVNEEFFTHSAGRHYMDNHQGPEKLKEYLSRI